MRKTLWSSFIFYGSLKMILNRNSWKKVGFNPLNNQLASFKRLKSSFYMRLTNDSKMWMSGLKNGFVFESQFTKYALLKLFSLSFVNWLSNCLRWADDDVFVILIVGLLLLMFHLKQLAERIMESLINPISMALLFFIMYLLKFKR